MAWAWERGGQCSGNAVHGRGLRPGLLLLGTLDGVPAGLYGLRVGRLGVAEDVGVAPHELFDQRAEHLLLGKRVVLGAHNDLERHVIQDVAELFGYLLGDPLVYRFQ